MTTCKIISTPTTKESKICHALATTSACNLKLCHMLVRKSDDLILSISSLFVMNPQSFNKG